MELRSGQVPPERSLSSNPTLSFPVLTERPQNPQVGRDASTHGDRTGQYTRQATPENPPVDPGGLRCESHRCPKFNPDRVTLGQMNAGDEEATDLRPDSYGETCIPGLLRQMHFRSLALLVLTVLSISIGRWQARPAFRDGPQTLLLAAELCAFCGRQQCGTFASPRLSSRGYTRQALDDAGRRLERRRTNRPDSHYRRQLCIRGCHKVMALRNQDPISARQL